MPALAIASKPTFTLEELQKATSLGICVRQWIRHVSDTEALAWLEQSCPYGYAPTVLSWMGRASDEDLDRWLEAQFTEERLRAKLLEKTVEIYEQRLGARRPF
jgi:hypothetical protein